MPKQKPETIYLPFPSVILEKIDNYLNKKYLADFLCKFSYFEEEIGKRFYPLYIEHGKNVEDYMRDVRRNVVEYFKDKIRKNISAFTFDERIREHIFSEYEPNNDDLNPEYIGFRFDTALSFTPEEVKEYCKAFKRTYKKAYSELLNVHSEKFDSTVYFVFTIWKLNGKDADKTENIIKENYREMFLNFNFQDFFDKYDWCEDVTAFDIPHFEEFCDSGKLSKIDYDELYKRFTFQKDEYIRVQTKGETEERKQEIIAYAENGYNNAMKDLAKELLDAYNEFITENEYNFCN